MQNLKDAQRLNGEAMAEDKASDELQSRVRNEEPKAHKPYKGKGPVTNGHTHTEDADEDAIGDMTEPVDPDINRVLTPQKQAVHA